MLGGSQTCGGSPGSSFGNELMRTATVAAAGEASDPGADSDCSTVDTTNEVGAALLMAAGSPALGSNAIMMSNMGLVAEQFAQDLFEASMERISQHFNTMVDAICISHIITNLFEQATVNVTEQHVFNIVEAAEQWCGERDNKTVVPTASEEASTILLEQLSTAIELAGEISEESELQEKLTSIVNRTSFDRARDAAEGMVAQN